MPYREYSIWRLQEAKDQYLFETKPVRHIASAFHKQHFHKGPSAGTNVGTTSKQVERLNGILSNVK